VRAWELWRVAPEFLEQAQDDATVLAIRDQERAGLDYRFTLSPAVARPRLKS
jgi:methionine synthase II (cobalamin-independent)